MLAQPSQTLLQAISALRDLASGSPSPSDDQNVISATGSDIVPTDTNAIVSSRTPAQVRRTLLQSTNHAYIDDEPSQVPT